MGVLQLPTANALQVAKGVRDQLALLQKSFPPGVTWQMATIEDGSQFVQRPLPGGAPGNAATAVVWNPVRKMFYAAVRFMGTTSRAMA